VAALDAPPSPRARLERLLKEPGFFDRRRISERTTTVLKSSAPITALRDSIVAGRSRTGISSRTAENHFGVVSPLIGD